MQIKKVISGLISIGVCNVIFTCTNMFILIALYIVGIITIGTGLFIGINTLIGAKNNEN